jgi:hypothetical protein
LKAQIAVPLDRPRPENSPWFLGFGLLGILGFWAFGLLEILGFWAFGSCALRTQD